MKILPAEMHHSDRFSDSYSNRKHTVLSTAAPSRFNISPSRAMARMGTWPEAKITALGPVATGSMKAQLALMAAGTISSRGSTPEPIAAAARIGISSAVVAVLLVISVRNVTDRQITAKHHQRMQSAQRAQRFADDLADARAHERVGDADSAGKQDEDAPRDLDGGLPVQQAPMFALAAGPFARPPRVPSLALPLGTRNMTNTASSATLASLAWGRFSQVLQPPKGSVRVIQANAVKANTVSVRFSSGPPGTHVGNGNVARPGNAAGDPQCDQRDEYDDHRQAPGHPVDKAELDAGACRCRPA